MDPLWHSWSAPRQGLQFPCSLVPASQRPRWSWVLSLRIQSISPAKSRCGRPLLGAVSEGQALGKAEVDWCLGSWGAVAAATTAVKPPRAPPRLSLWVLGGKGRACRHWAAVINLPGQKATEPAERGGAPGASAQSTAPGTGQGARGGLSPAPRPWHLAPPTGLGAGSLRSVSKSTCAPVPAREKIRFRSCHD